MHIQDIICETRRKKGILEDLAVNGRVILQWLIKKTRSVIVNSVYMAQDRDKWRAVVKAIMNLLIS